MSFFCIAQVDQKIRDVLSIRNYSFSLSLELSEQKHSVYVYTSSGVNVMSSEEEVFTHTRYFFKGQEKSNELGLYFFPSRLYSVNSIRFLQVDPAAQFASPYSFLGGDPVNFIDKDGNVAKPLVLYSYETREHTGRINKATAEDLAEHVDAHYMPLSEFVTTKHLPNFEWNGNVYIDAHCDAFGHIFAEKYTDKQLIKTPPEDISLIRETRAGERLIGVSHKSLGKEIARLSQKTGVKVNAITIPSCEGETAAKELSKEVVKESRALNIEQHFSANGLRSGFREMYFSPRIQEDRALARRVSNPVSDEMPLHYMIGDVYDSTIYDQEMEGEKIKTTYRIDGEELPTLRGVEMDNLVNGRIARDLRPFISETPF